MIYKHVACSTCGYDLVATAPTGHCPECGTPVASSYEAARHRAVARPLHWVAHVAIGMCVAASVGLVYIFSFTLGFTHASPFIGLSLLAYAYGRLWTNAVLSLLTSIGLVIIGIAEMAAPIYGSHPVPWGELPWVLVTFVGVGMLAWTGLPPRHDFTRDPLHRFGVAAVIAAFVGMILTALAQGVLFFWLDDRNLQSLIWASILAISNASPFGGLLFVGWRFGHRWPAGVTVLVAAFALLVLMFAAIVYVPAIEPMAGMMSFTWPGLTWISVLVVGVIAALMTLVRTRKTVAAS